MNSNPAIVLNASANGLGVIHSLIQAEKPIPIFTMDKDRCLFGSYSKHVKKRYSFKNDNEFISIIRKVYEEYQEKPVLYPTGNDYFYNILINNYYKLGKYAHVPINVELKDLSNKIYQINVCKRIGVPIPQLYECDKNDIISKSIQLKYPFIIKPVTRKDVDQSFRNSIIYNENELNIFHQKIDQIKVDEFLISEIIQGDSSNLWTYGSYFSFGEPLGEYVGRKLTQYPNNYGVGCICENKFNEIILSYGRTILEYIRYNGVSQVEFKYDHRDRKYKLIEINPRSWLWAKLPTICGVNLPLIQYYWMTNNVKLSNKQSFDEKYLVVLPYLLLKALKWNLKDFYFYLNNFTKCSMAMLSFDDMRPFIRSIYNRRT